ncbi:MAG: polysaccharide biosynthesis protein [Robiginitomaculum sp.]|nr:MAG: polysaccharide biosynthesis protein [Robiginitomaculum sp.]
MRVLTYLIGMFLVMGLASCASGPAPSAARGPGAPSQIRTGADYHLGSGDQLRVIVFGEEDLSGEFVVDGGGQVSLPLVGEVSAKGKTVRQFQRAVEAKLKEGYLTDPRVSAEVLNFRPFYILGEVKSPGEYPYLSGLTVMNAVATAEGFTYRADTRKVYIKRAGEIGEYAYTLTTETPVQPGDTIRIGERFF